MSDPLHHAMSSARKFGGVFEDYLPIHDWFDLSKEGFGDARHRSMRHHTEGIGWCIEKFGRYIKVVGPDGAYRNISTRMIAEQHLIEDLGFLPTMADWLKCMKLESWMIKRAMARPDLGKLRAGDADGSYDPFQHIGDVTKGMAARATEKRSPAKPDRLVLK